MDWTDNGHDLVWDILPLTTREMNNADSYFEQLYFVSMEFSEVMGVVQRRLLSPGSTQRSLLAPLGLCQNNNMASFDLLFIMMNQ